MTRDGTAVRSAGRWLSWLLGVAVLASLITAVVHFSEEREFARLLGRARPQWLVWAVLLQAATYLPQGAIWRAVTRAAGIPVSLARAYGLSLAKLFVDQALPSAGVSGTVVVAKALEHHGVPRPVVMASVVINTASYYAAYVLSLGVALAIAAVQGHTTPVIVVVSLLFGVFAVMVTLAVLVLSGREQTTVPVRLLRLPVVKTLLAAIREAEPQLAHRPGLLVRATGLQLAIVLLDATTLWVLLRALGSTTSFPGVFASFMISSLFRTVSFVPGGLGAFEAASVLSLKVAGVSVLVALSATLLFRGLSFWLPMIPGLILSRRMTGRPLASRGTARPPTPG